MNTIANAGVVGKPDHRPKAVLDKAVAVLRAVEAGGPAGLVELQAATGLPRATAHRLAVSLERHGLLRRDDAGRFCLGLSLIGLGAAASETFPLAARARPVLEALRDETGESVQLFVRDGDGRRCVVSLPSDHALRWIVPEGALLPLAVGSAGHVLAADGAGASTGWVESIEEREVGVASVSAPVIAADGSIVGAISVSGPVERLTRRPGARYGDAVTAAASRVSAAVR